MGGFDDGDDKSNFSDDGLDALPVNAFLALEQNAIQSTQPPAPHPVLHPRPANKTEEQYPRPRVPKALHGPRAAQPNYADSDSEQFDTGLFDDNDVATPVEEKEALVAARH